jgi:hypothetical protein
MAHGHSGKSCHGLSTFASEPAKRFKVETSHATIWTHRVNWWTDHLATKVCTDDVMAVYTTSKIQLGTIFLGNVCGDDENYAFGAKSVDTSGEYVAVWIELEV